MNNSPLESPYRRYCLVTNKMITHFKNTRIHISRQKHSKIKTGMPISNGFFYSTVCLSQLYKRKFHEVDNLVESPNLSTLFLKLRPKTFEKKGKTCGDFCYVNLRSGT